MESLHGSSMVHLEPKGRIGETPLHLAAKNGYYEIVKALLDSNANKEAVEGSFGGTPLFLAITNQHSSVVRLLVSKGANIDATNWCKHSALEVAVMELKDKELVKHLLYLSCYRNSGVRAESGGVVDSELLPEEFSFFWRHGHTSGFSLTQTSSTFLNLGDVEADIFREKVIAKGLLHRAVLSGNAEGTEALLEVMKGIESRKEKQSGSKLPLENRYVNSRLDHSDMAIHMAARTASTIACLEILVQHGAELNAQTSRQRGSQTPLHVAVRASNLKAVEYLLNHGALTTIANSEGRTPIQLATYREEKELVEVFKRVLR